jgi:predicted DNA-binding transcriptional regulator AlpA
MSSISRPTQILSTDEVAAFLGISRDALELRRRRGSGPPFVRVSPRMIRYRVEDVEAWLAARIEQPGAAGKNGGAQ